MTHAADKSLKRHLRRLARHLLGPSPADWPGDQASAFETEDACLTAGDLRELIELARAECQRRALRSRHFAAELLGEPGWDILVNLFALRAAGQLVSFDLIYQASGVPAATAVRWLSILEAEGLLFRRRDPNDQRSVWLDLTDPGMERMTAHFRGIKANLSA